MQVSVLPTAIVSHSPDCACTITYQRHTFIKTPGLNQQLIAETMMLQQGEWGIPLLGLGTLNRAPLYSSHMAFLLSVNAVDCTQAAVAVQLMPQEISVCAMVQASATEARPEPVFHENPLSGEAPPSRAPTYRSPVKPFLPGSANREDYHTQPEAEGQAAYPGETRAVAGEPLGSAPPPASAAVTAANAEVEQQVLANKPVEPETGAYSTAAEADSSQEHAAQPETIHQEVGHILSDSVADMLMLLFNHAPAHCGETGTC